MATNKKQAFFINFFGCALYVKCYIDAPSFGTYDTPGDNGSIEITDIWFSGADIYPIVEQIPNFEEKICDEIRKQL